MYFLDTCSNPKLLVGRLHLPSNVAQVDPNSLGRRAGMHRATHFDIVEGMVSAAIVTGTCNPLDSESTSYTFLVESPGSFMAIVPLDCLAYERSVIPSLRSQGVIPKRSHVLCGHSCGRDPCMIWRYSPLSKSYWPYDLCTVCQPLLHESQALTL